jgi:hypothetical protein
MPGVSAIVPPPGTVGRGFHVFDAWYFLLGLGLQGPCQATSTEFEASVARVVAPGLWWLGAYASGGFQSGRPPGRRPASDLATCFDEFDRFEDTVHEDGDRRISYDRDAKYPNIEGKYSGRGLRVGAGVEGGWRFIGLDVGYLRNDALAVHRFVKPRPEDAGVWQKESAVHGVRFRLGLSVAMELFTGSDVTYGREAPRCCKTEGSETACECKRYPAGMSLFLYYANELYFRNGNVWDDGMLGFTLKFAVGVPD